MLDVCYANAYLTLLHSNKQLGSVTIDLILHLDVLARPVGYGLVDLPLQLLALAHCSKLRLTVCASCTQGTVVNLISLLCKLRYGYPK